MKRAASEEVGDVVAHHDGDHDARPEPEHASDRAEATANLPRSAEPKDAGGEPQKSRHFQDEQGVEGDFHEQAELDRPASGIAPKKRVFLEQRETGKSEQQSAIRDDETGEREGAARSCLHTRRRRDRREEVGLMGDFEMTHAHMNSRRYARGFTRMGGKCVDNLWAERGAFGTGCAR